MYDASFCRELHVLQVLYETFSTEMLKSALELSQLLKDMKNPEKNASPPTYFGGCSLNFGARLMCDTLFCRGFYALQLLYETFFSKVRSTQDPLKKLFRRAAQGGRDFGQSVYRRFYIP